jgi:hypothetical protein
LISDRDDDDVKDGPASPVSSTSTRQNISAPSSSSGSSSTSNITRIRIGQTVGKISESAPFLGNTGKTSGITISCLSVFLFARI